MKTRNTFFLLIVVVLVLSACNRAFTPYDAANNPPKRCRNLN